MKMTIYRHGGTSIHQDPATSMPLEAMQKQVGGYIQFCPMPRGSDKLFVVNEEGLNLGLPHNKNATQAFQDEWHRFHKPSELNPQMMQLVGDVIVFQGTKEELSEL